MARLESEQLARSLQVDLISDPLNSAALDYHGWSRRPVLERVLSTLGRLLERHQ